MSRDVRNRLRAAYDAQAEARNNRELPEWKRIVRERFLATLRAEGCADLLEIGSGPGHDAAYFSDHGMTVTCIDLSPEMVRCCREKGLEAHVMDATELRFLDASFQAAYAFNSLLHLAKSELGRALDEIRRVLRPQGIFFLGLYGGFRHEGVWQDDTYTPKRFFSFHTDEQLTEETGGRFEVVLFDRIPVESDDSHLHFQSLILKKGSI